MRVTAASRRRSSPGRHRGAAPSWPGREVAVAVNHRTGQPIAASTEKERIQTAGSFLDAIAEWGWPEAPARRLVFPRDAPKLPHPLPRYLPPDQERALLAALEASPNRLRADALLLLLRPPGCASLVFGTHTLVGSNLSRQG